MLNFELLREIYHSIQQNKVRTILSGFGISWGILILVILLGTGGGFQKAVMNIFNVFAQKSIYVYGNTTSQKYQHIKEGQIIRFDENYLEITRNHFPEITAISPEVSSSQLVLNKDKSGVFKITGVESDYMQIRILPTGEGRLFNKSDMEKERDVAIIGKSVESNLFGHKTALNKHIQIGGSYFRVIGILKNDNIFSASEINSIYIPYSSYRRTINNNPEFSSFCLCLSQDADTKLFEDKLRNYIAHKSQFSIDDKQAVYIANFETQTSAFESLFKTIRVFIWIVGICFLISGVVGICNIMFVVIKERTNEIGIRLAVGAQPRSIISLILLESIFITTISGLMGLIVGKGFLLIIDWLLSIGNDNMLMEKTTLNTTTALAALVVLIIAGVIAGAFPAIKASNIEPVDAIRYENRG